MNKTQLIEAVALKSGMKKKEAEQAVNAMTEAVVEAMKNGEKVQLVGFGTFEVKTREARTARNPKTGEAISVPASKHPAFSASKALKDQLN
jgi:DNA-binding protein HU-beta